jgi:hypothetical protein
MPYDQHVILNGSTLVLLYDIDAANAIRQFPGQYSEPVYNPTLSSSPWTYRNVESRIIFMVIAGGTVSKIDSQKLGDIANSWTATGRTSHSGLILRPTEAVRITFSVAPTISITSYSSQT